jgi:tetratricopeptide (TPR) repeat protein
LHRATGPKQGTESNSGNGHRHQKRPLALLLDSGGSPVRDALQVRGGHHEAGPLAADVRSGQQGIPGPQDHGQGSRNQGRKPEDHRRLVEADKLSIQGDYEAAWKIVDRYLVYENPDDAFALNIAQRVWLKQGRLALAYQFARRAADVSPGNPYIWSNLGQLEQEIYRFDKAEQHYRKAELLAKDDEARASIYLNWSCMLVTAGRWKEAETVGLKAFALKPDNAKVRGNLGITYLALGKWPEGWEMYEAIVGFDKGRRKVKYADIPRWDGSAGKAIVIHAEQGLGDEISFSSMVPDAIKASKSVILDCTEKLKGLFQRSFPEAKVFGTKYFEDGVSWDTEAHEIEADISIGSLGQFYRPSPESCPGTPWLVADPDRVAMWKGLFEKQGKPVIGIAWSGGVPWTGDRHRRWSLEELLPIFRSIDAVWISLEYKDAGKEIAAFKELHPEIDLRQYAFGTLTSDYDDTAALVAALDHVVSMQTSVIHLAGGLGKDCFCFVNKHGQWRYGVEGSSIPWYRSVKLYRNVNGWPLEQAAKDLEAKFADPARAS